MTIIDRRQFSTALTAALGTAGIVPPASAAPDAARQNFVLVHGQAFGGWCWKEVAALLRRRGHDVYTFSLTGLGDRRHLLTPAIGHQTHVTDIVSLFEMYDIRDATLVAWSYGGMPVTGSLARLRDRLRAVLYLDAFVPQDGKALVDYIDPAGRETQLALAAEGKPLPVPDVARRWGLSDPALLAFIAPRLAPHPTLANTQPVSVPSGAFAPPVRFGYMWARGNKGSPFGTFFERARADRAWRTATFDVIHLFMLTDPALTAALLIDFHETRPRYWT